MIVRKSEYADYLDQTGDPITLAMDNIYEHLRANFDNVEKGSMLREAFKNCLEAHTDPSKEKERLIRIEPIFDISYFNKPFAVPKLSLTNSTAESYDGKKLAYLFNSTTTTKEFEGDGGTNRGTGLLHTAASCNALGIIATTRKDDRYYRVMVYRSTADIFTRSTWVNDQGMDQNFKELEFSDFTKEEQDIYNNFVGDFYNLILLGNNDDHNTFVDPYGIGNTDDKFIPNDICGRFDKFNCEIPVKILFVDLQSFSTQLLSKAELINKYALKTQNVKNITYAYADGKINPFMIELGHSGGGISLVHEEQGERYEVQDGKKWLSCCGQFGFIGDNSKANRLYVAIHITDPQIHNNYIRNKLMKKQVILELNDYKKQVYENQPQWVIDLFKSAANKKGGDDVLDSVQKYLDDKLDKMKTHVDINGSASILTQTQNGQFLINGRAPKTKPGRNRNRSKNKPQTTHARPIKTATPVNGRIAPKGKSHFIKAPQHMWVEDPVIIKSIGLENKGCIHDRNQSVYWLNGMFPTNEPLLAKVIDTVICRYSHANLFNNKAFRTFVTDEVKNHMALKVGLFIADGLIERKAKHFTEAQIQDQLLSPISLTAALQRCAITAAGEVWGKIANTNYYKREFKPIADSLSEFKENADEKTLSDSTPNVQISTPRSKFAAAEKKFNDTGIITLPLAMAIK